MTLILEIAAGIVLAILILRNLEIILSLGVVLVIGAVLLAIGVSAIFWAANNQRIMELVPLLAFFLIGYFLSKFISKHTGLKQGEAGVFLGMAFMLLLATAVFSAVVYEWSSDAANPLPYLFLLPIIGLWVWVWVKTSRLIRQHKKEQQARVMA